MSTRTRRLAAVASSALLATAVVAGCGEDSDDNASGDGGSNGGDYCGQVEDMKGQFEALSNPQYTLNDISETADVAGNAADAAPNDIESSWKSVHSAMGDFESGLSDLGVKKDEPLQESFQKLAKEDPKNKKKILDSMSGMQKVQPDFQKIDKQVKKECDISLSGSTGGQDGGSQDGGEGSGS